jgi:hypothetical protein
MRKCQILLWKNILIAFIHRFISSLDFGYNGRNEVISLKSEEMNEIDQEEEEKRYLLDLMRLQNEALKRVYKNTIDNEKNSNPKGR